MSAATRTPTGYLPPLDGLRGLAVLLVFLYHARLLPMGWMGVQLFFVLSGFLITRVLRQNRHLARGQFLTRFYWRRILRILPVYLLFIALTALLLHLVSSRHARPLIDCSPFLLTFTFNFQTAADLFWHPPFSHLWSLSVEEQFYLIWPFVVFACPRERLFHVCVALILLGPVIRFGIGEHYDAWYFEHFRPDRRRGYQTCRAMFIYLLPFSHADAFAFGALLTVTPERLHRFLRRHSQLLLPLLVLLFAGLGLWAAFHYSSHNLLNGFYHIHLRKHGQFVWGYSMINLLGAALIAALIHSPVWGRVFSLPPLTWLGKISYGFYVYHPLVIALLLEHYEIRIREITGVQIALSVAISLPVSTISYFVMERPLLRLKRFLRFAPAADDSRPDSR